MCTDQGCFREGSKGRALIQKEFKDITNLTTAGCANLCSGYRYFATEYGSECFCGTKMENGAYQVPDSSCNTPCGGDANDTCGGNSLLSVYKTSFSAQEPQANFTYLGCGGEPDNARALDRVVQVLQLTRKKCLLMCAYGEFQFAGVEYGNECWCGNKINNIKLNGTCDFPCAGDSSETCGGSLALNVFLDHSWKDRT